MGRRMLLKGGHVYSPADPFATAMLVIDDVIAWVGDDAGADVHRDAVTEVVHLEGALVTPVFVDAHVHATSTGLLLNGLDLTATKGLGDMLLRLREHQSTTSVLLGHGWDDTHWPAGPTRQDLDAVVGSVPAYLSRIDVHSAVASSALLAMCPGIERLDGYSEHGVMSREAHHRVRSLALASLTAEDRRQAQAATLRRAAGLGIGSLHELAGPAISGPDDLLSLLSLTEAGSTPTVVGYWGELDGFAEAERLGARGAAGDLFADGALGSHTACLRNPYLDQPTSSGAAYLDAHSVSRHVAEATRRGLQAGFHVIGDRATDIVIDGFEQAAAVAGIDAMRSARHRLEHVEMLDAHHIGVMATLGIVASVQPAFDAAWGGPTGMYQTRLGVERAHDMNPLASMASAGVMLAFGSDAPVTPLDPWGGVRAAAFHSNPRQSISVRAAFAAHTRGGRRAAREEHLEPGVLAPGAPASLAVWAPGPLAVQATDQRVSAWSTDPRSGTPGLPDLTGDAPECWLTVVGGTTIHDAGAFA